jgi:predicted transcriptional regulator
MTYALKVHRWPILAQLLIRTKTGNNSRRRKMVKRRSHLETKYDILRAIQTEGEVVRPTHIMYKANLSWSEMKKYLKELEDQSLIKLNPNQHDQRKITLTPKGIECVEVVQNAKSMLGENGNR